MNQWLLKKTWHMFCLHGWFVTKRKKYFVSLKPGGDNAVQVKYFYFSQFMHVCMYVDMWKNGTVKIENWFLSKMNMCIAV